MKTFISGFVVIAGILMLLPWAFELAKLIVGIFGKYAVWVVR